MSVGRQPVNRIERAAPIDLMYLAMQGSTVPEQFGAIVVLRPVSGFDAAAATSLLADRIGAVPRLRQRVMRVPPGCGRALWVDDAGFDITQHVESLTCPSPGDERALLEVAAGLVLRPLCLDRPLWAAAFVEGLSGGRVALIFVIQHALADGLGGLAVLGALVDGAPAPEPGAFPMPPPSRGRLAADAFHTRTRALIKVAARIGTGDGAPRVRGPGIGRAAPCSLLQPTGPRRRVAVATAPLGQVRDVAHRHGATVNDIVLTAIGGTLHTCLERRGEHISAFIVGIPVSERHAASATTPGNRVSRTRALIPGGGDFLERLKHVTKVMQVSKRTALRPSVAFVAAAIVRATVALGVYGWYMRRQRYLHTIVTNVHGADVQLTFGGAPITEIVPLAVDGGSNVTVSFAVLSYMDTLTITVIADPDAMPDLAHLTAALQAELDTLTRGGSLSTGGQSTAPAKAAARLELASPDSPL